MSDVISRSGRVAFVVVTAGYLAVTVAESILAPLFPAVTGELGLDLGMAGLAFGLLTGSIAVGNLIGGWLLSRAGVKPALEISLLMATAGSALAALAADGSSFVVAQTLIGAGTGVFFAPGIDVIGRAAKPYRRGLAMGMFGVAFSAGLAIAALLAALGARTGWRMAFWVAALACAAGALVVAFAPLPGRASRASGEMPHLGRALAVPVTVGAIGTISQYGTVGFMAIFAVTAWDMSPAAAALVIAAGRVLSVPGKLIVGMGADRWGSLPTLTVLAVCLGVTGALWTVVPGLLVAVPAAVVYAAAVSGLFPIANLLAVDGFGDRGAMLGVFRSAHIGVGAVGAWVIGAVSARAGLGPTLMISAALPILLLMIVRSPARGALT